MSITIYEMPAADVIEVEMPKKNIEANLDEARKLRDEHSSELIRAFQQGRMFGHECDLEMIKRKENKMSVSKWAYTPKKCDGDYCPADCDNCSKANEDESEDSKDKATAIDRWNKRVKK